MGLLITAGAGSRLGQHASCPPPWSPFAESRCFFERCAASSSRGGARTVFVLGHAVSEIRAFVNLVDATNVRTKGARLLAIGRQFSHFDCFDCGFFLATRA